MLPELYPAVALASVVVGSLCTCILDVADSNLAGAFEPNKFLATLRLPRHEI